MMSRNSSPVLAAVCVCTVLVVGFVAAINLAVPQLAAGSLHPTPSQLLWIVDAYVVLFACLVIPAGALGDRVGRKGVLLIGLLIFAAGALISAFAGDVPVMLAGRAITGVGAACVLPNGLAVLIHATEPARRPHAIAIWSAVTGAGGILGNLGGGAILTAGSWRWLFAAVAPIAALCALWVALAAPRSSRHQRELSPWAAGLLTLATLALLMGIIEGPSRGWGSAFVVTAFLSAALLATAWVRVELRSAKPLLDPRLFKIPGLRAASLGMLVAFLGMFGFFYLNASLLQYGRGFTVLQAGLGILPMAVPVLVIARFVPRLVTRFGERTVLGAAFLTIGGGLLGVTTAISRGYWTYAGWLVVVGFGVAFALPALTHAITAAMPREQAGVAGGLQSTTRELGSALGVAIIGTLLTARFGPHSVAAALAVSPAAHSAVIAAYTDAAATALRVVAGIVLAAGTLVIADMTLSRRPAGKQPTEPPVLLGRP